MGLPVLLILSCQAAARLPNPFATDTPTPTSTFTPSATPSPTPTFTPTPLPSGVMTRVTSSGGTSVIDYDNKYQLELPQEWVVIDLTQEDISKALDQAARQDPQLAEMAQGFKHLDPDIIRLIGLSRTRKYKSNSYPTLLSIAAVADPIASSMPMSFVTAMIEDKVLQGATNTSWEVKTNINGIEIGIVQGSMRFPSATGGRTDVRTKVIAFQSDKKLIMVQIITPREFGDEVLPAADQIIDTIKLIKSR